MSVEQDRFFKLFPEFCERIETLRKDQYVDATDDDTRQAKSIFEQIKKDPELVKSYWTRLTKTDDIQGINYDFNVGTHLKAINMSLDGLGQSYIDDYANCTEQYIGVNARNLLRTNTFLPEIEAIKYKKQVHRLLDLFNNGSSEMNRQLAELLNTYTLEIKITNSEEFNGSMDVFSESKRAVLTLDKGLFDKKNKNVQGFMVPHELGHFLDYALRPKGSHLFHQVSEECFADIVAAKFLKDSKMNLDDVVDFWIELSKSIKEDSNHQKIKDRISAIKAIDIMCDYSKQLEKNYHLIQKAQQWFEYRAKKSSFDQNLEVVATRVVVQKQTAYSTLKDEQKNNDEDDITTEAYIAKRASVLLYRKFAQKHFIADDSFTRGYCTSLPLLTLRDINAGFISRIPNQPDPANFVQRVKKEFPDCIYASSESQTLSDILTSKKVSFGSFVIFDLVKTEGQPEENSSHFHTMIFKEIDKKGKCLCMGFDDEQKSYALAKKRQCGYVIDLYKMIYSMLKQSHNMEMYRAQTLQFPENC